MKLLSAAILGFVGLAVSFASGADKKQVDNRVPVRLQIRHADPWMVKALIEGASISQPELSTIWGVRGGGTNRGANNAQGSSLLKDGYLVVNPTDNSLWWYPNTQ